MTRSQQTNCEVRDKVGDDCRQESAAPSAHAREEYAYGERRNQAPPALVQVRDRK